MSVADRSDRNLREFSNFLGLFWLPKTSPTIVVADGGHQREGICRQNPSRIQGGPRSRNPPQVSPVDDLRPCVLTGTQTLGEPLQYTTEGRRGSCSHGDFLSDHQNNPGPQRDQSYALKHTHASPSEHDC